jgi:N-acetylglucosaminyldiphosphoundecaprenol N-acetyl-beta-D-mannosaminyltransferase
VGDRAAAANLLIDLATCGDGGYAALCNVHLLMEGKKHVSVADALCGASVIFSDGAPVAWLQRRLRAERARRVAGPDLMLDVIDRGRSHGLRHVLFGGTAQVSSAVESSLRKRFGGVAIVGAEYPSAESLIEDEQRWLGEIRDAGAHVVWCALGAPKQELWMARVAEALRPAFLVGVGAAFDFHAGAKERAPLWMQDRGLEWLHRLATEPGRLGGRYARTNSAFVVAATSEIVRGRLFAPLPSLTGSAEARGE